MIKVIEPRPFLFRAHAGSFRIRNLSYTVGNEPWFRIPMLCANTPTTATIPGRCRRDIPRSAETRDLRSVEEEVLVYSRQSRGDGKVKVCDN